MDVVSKLRETMTDHGAAGLLISKPANVRYLSGFTSPEDGRVLITRRDIKLITDGRYVAQAAEESRLSVDIRPVAKRPNDYLASLLKGEALAVESDHLSHADVLDLSDKLGQDCIALKDVLKAERIIKNEAELSALRQAADITDRAFEHIRGFIKVGMAEIEVALELERYMRLAGAEGKSFDITVASGVRSSMPHGTASHKLLAAAELVTLDYGCVVDGYHSDMTRTLALGEVSEDAQRLYQAVLEAQESALAAIHAGVDGQAVDKVARDSLTAAGYGDYFSHSLGHGVGLEIHEYPRMSPIVSEILAANMAITVEPGAYIPGDMGVRIEDLVIVTEDGIENLSHSPKHLISL